MRFSYLKTLVSQTAWSYAALRGQISSEKQPQEESTATQILYAKYTAQLYALKIQFWSFEMIAQRAPTPLQVKTNKVSNIIQNFNDRLWTKLNFEV